LIDLTNKDLTGKDAEAALGRAHITVNKNTVPFETRSPFITSGVRIGVPAVTTRGMKQQHIRQIVGWIDAALKASQNEERLHRIGEEVKDFCKSFPLFAQ
ncbi:MAG TPA: serine hydroxymethyltransferase, partial [Oligoflexia bacterium]|nr:serine hydroxymethyltransferase [Oligoflexia bacterium]